MSTNNNSNNDILGQITSHLRAFRGQIDECQPTQAEAKALDNAGIINSKARSYLVWRRSCLVVASPFVNTSMILGLLNLRDLFSDNGSLNALGIFVMFLTSIDSIFLNIGMSVSMHIWSKPNISMKALRLGWIASFVLPLVPALFPLEMLLKKDDIEAIEDGMEDADTFFLVLKLTLALSYAIQLLPAVITFPGGAVRGALRILGLLPNSSLPGWILMVTAPFYSLLVCVALVIVIQVAGNGILFCGTLLLVAAPLVYMVRRRLFVTDKKEDNHEHQLRMTQKVSTALTGAGLFLLLIWAFTAESRGIRVLGHRKSDDMKFLTYGNGIRMAFEMVGRLLVTIVLFSDIVLAMTICHWRESKQSKKDERESEADMHHFDTFLNSAKAVDRPAPGTRVDAGEPSPMPVPADFAGPTVHVVAYDDTLADDDGLSV